MADDKQLALIVGAGSGLSASIARVFAGAGMKIALAARGIDDLGALAAEVGAETLRLRRNQARRGEATVRGPRSRRRRA